MSYIGNEPIVSATRTITEISATSGQTVFVANGGYTVGKIDVFVNGSQLQTSDFVATNGSSVTLNTACAAGDDIRLVAWGLFSIGNVTPAALSTGGPSWDTGGVLTPLSKLQISQDAGSNNRLVFRGTSGSSYRWNIDNFGSTNDFRIFRENEADGTAGVLYGVFSADGGFRFNSGYGSAATAYGCRAWVNFNGSGGASIRSSGNVSSVTRNSTGNYTINFGTALVDTNYSVVGVANGFSGFEDNNAIRTGTRSTTSINLAVVNGGATVYVDSTAVQLAVFR